MHLETGVGNLPDHALRPSKLARGDGVEIIGIRIAGIVPAGDGKDILSPEQLFILFVAPDGDAHHQPRKTIAGNPDQAVGCAIGGKAFVEGFDAVQIEGRFASDQDGQVDPPLPFPFHKFFPLPRILFFGSGLVLIGGKEKTPLAAQIAPVRDVVNGTADVQAGDRLVSLVPILVQQSTDRLHYDRFPISACPGGEAISSQRFSPFSYPITQTAR